LSGPRFSDLGKSPADYAKDLSDSLEAFSVESILKTTLVVAGLTLIAPIAIYGTAKTAPAIVKGAGKTIQEVPTLVGNVLRLPFRLGGWFKQVRKDMEPSD